MRPTKTAISGLAIALAYMGSSATAQTIGTAPTPAAEVDQNAAIIAFFEEYDAQLLALSPLSKSYRGIKDSDYGRWDDFTAAAQTRANDAERSALKEMRARFDPAKLSPENRLFENRAERNEAAFKYNDYGYAFDQMNGAQSELLAFLINIHRVDNKSDARDYVSRLCGIGPSMNQAIARAKARAAQGIMPPKWVYPYVINDARNVITGAPFDDGPDAPWFADFKDKVGKLNISQIEKDLLVADAAQALNASVKPAYEALISEMTAQEKVAGTDDGVWRFKDGAGYYAERLANYTTTNMTPDQIHNLGLAPVARIHKEMGVVQKKMGVKGDLPAFFKYMRMEPKFYAPETAEGRACT
jgi:uncharacterized protein (DUF885 family)